MKRTTATNEQHLDKTTDVKDTRTMLFPKKLVAFRKKNGYTQQMLADRVGIHVTQIKRYEAGTAQPTLEVFYKIILALHVSADEMLFEHDERGPDEDFTLHFETISKLSPQEKVMMKEVIEGMLLKYEAKRWLQRE